MSFPHQVIVAGSGPAGAVAARTLAAAGVKTLLVDRAAFPRNKPCGGGISDARAAAIPLAERGAREHRRAPHLRLHLEGPDRSSLDLESADPCVLLIRRVEFDHALVREAAAAGAEIEGRFEITQVQQDAEGVTLQSRDGRTLRAPLVIAADGVHSVIAKRLGVNARWPATSLAIDMMEETPVATLRAERPDVLWVAYAYNGLDGYSYVFPKTQHVNVGIGCLLSHFEERGAGAAVHAAAGVRRVARARRRAARPIRSEAFHAVPDSRRRAAAVGAWRGRVLFAGDAGGFVQRDHGRRHLLRDGLRRIGRSRHRRIGPPRVGGQAAGTRGPRGRIAVRSAVAEGAWGRALRRRPVAEVSIFRSSAREPDRARRFDGRRADGHDARLHARRAGYTALRRRMLVRFPMTMLRMARQKLMARSA